mmetsp:Transcript_19676/g.19773  ORF Transcript_19676/g.19773 Transcript_19676/m.19773 type:complete len:350 (+) Transcript_19676:55-1104(+)
MHFQFTILLVCIIINCIDASSFAEGSQSQYLHNSAGSDDDNNSIVEVTTPKSNKKRRVRRKKARSVSSVVRTNDEDDSFEYLGNPNAMDTELEQNFKKPALWDEKNLISLKDLNRKWKAKIVRKNPNYFKYNSLGHFPKILWIGCSDSRFPVNDIIGQPPGSCYVHRNIGNLVVNTDPNGMSAIQYAVDYLKVKHIIVCGHYDCYGVNEALELADLGSPLDNWIENIRDVYRLHRDELMAIPTLEEKQRRLSELNTIEQAINVYKDAHVQKHFQETSKTEVEILRYLKDAHDSGRVPFLEPQIHAFVMDKTGKLNKLDILGHINRHIKELDALYDVHNYGKISVDRCVS